MNLVKDPWLPFKLKDGSEKTLPLSEISNPDIVDFALPRADFQGVMVKFYWNVFKPLFSFLVISDWGLNNLRLSLTFCSCKTEYKIGSL